MIPLFKKLRNLPSGKAGKIVYHNTPPGKESRSMQYVRYAIGEIILTLFNPIITKEVTL